MKKLLMFSIMAAVLLGTGCAYIPDYFSKTETEKLIQTDKGYLFTIEAVAPMC